MLPTWTILAFLAPLLWSLVGFLDKFVISKYIPEDQSTGPLVIYTGLSGFIISVAIILFGHTPTGIPTRDVFWILVAGIIYVASFIPYLAAMQEADASVIISLYQVGPVFSYLLGFAFLGETLTLTQMLAGVLVISGAIALSSEPGKRFRPNGKTLGLMLLSSFGLSMNALLFKYFALDSLDPWATAFWEYVGSGLFAVFLLIAFGSYRRQFVSLLRKGGLRIAGLNLTGEIVTILGTLAMSFASLSVPLAVVSIISGTQPFMALIIGALFTVFLPNIITERRDRTHLVHRIASSTVIFVGVVLLFV
jgi:drug/metabolite transporter (DMT)-like permease